MFLGQAVALTSRVEVAKVFRAMTLVALLVYIGYTLMLLTDPETHKYSRIHGQYLPRDT